MTGVAPALVLDGVAKRYGAFEAVRPLSLEVAAGELVAVLGPSGSGKTTVLRLVGGFAEPSAGRVLIAGRDVTAVPVERRPCHTVFQDYALFPHMSVARNVGYGLMVRGVPRAECQRRVRAMLGVVGLEAQADRLPSQVSGGQRQRAALARALAPEPALVLLDEPLAALDAGLRRQMQEFLKGVQRRVRTTFLLVTHDQEEAVTLADRVVVMRDGGVEQVGTPREVYWRPRTAFVAGFVGENNLVEVEARSAPGGVAEVEGPLGRFAVPGEGGGRRLLALRPESVRLADAGAGPGEVSVAGEVADAVFAGPTSRLLVAVPGMGGRPLRVQVASRAGGGDLPPAGARVRLAFRPAEAALVPLAA